MKKATMDSIARELGISKVTVHKALTGQTGVSIKTAREVRACADRQGYSYLEHNYMRGRGFLFLARRTFFLNEQENFYSRIYQHLMASCKEAGAKLFLQFYETEQDQRVVEDSLAASPPDGIFIAGQQSYSTMQRLQSYRTPIVFIDYYSPLFPFNYVYLNTYFNAYELTHFAITQGHRNVGYIGYTSGQNTLTDRYFGFRKALAEFRLPFVREWYINENLDLKPEFSIALPPKLPTVFLCHCDATARKLLAALKLQHIRVPEDLSILSFDDTETALLCEPTLTSMGIEKSKFAQAAIMLMQNKLHKPDCGESVLLRPEIVMRESFRPNLVKNGGQKGGISPEFANFMHLD